MGSRNLDLQEVCAKIVSRYSGTQHGSQLKLVSIRYQKVHITEILVSFEEIFVHCPLKSVNCVRPYFEVHVFFIRN